MEHISERMIISSWVHGTLCTDGEKGGLRAKPMADFVGCFGGMVVIATPWLELILSILNP